MDAREALSHGVLTPSLRREGGRDPMAVRSLTCHR